MNATRSDNSATAPDDPAPLIARIDRLTDTGRANWFGLMAYLVFVFITVLGVEDADFFIPSRQTQLPLVNVAIPTDAFFVFAPVLGAALYVYLHLTVRKITGALCAAPARVDRLPLEHHLKPWLLVDLVLRWRGDGAVDRRPLDNLATLTVVGLVWLAGPLVLFAMWVRTWPAHDELMTTLAGLSLMLAVYAGGASWLRLQRDLKPDSVQRRRDGILRALGVLSVGALVLIMGLIKTEIGRPPGHSNTGEAAAAGHTGRPAIEPLRDIDWWFRLAQARLAEVQFSALPPDQADPISARHRYRGEWCGRAGLERPICGNLPDPGAVQGSVLWARRASWCQQNGVVDCPTYFNERDADFRTEWRGYRQRIIDALPKPDLRGADLRGADLSRASLTGVILREARLAGAVFSGAEMQGTDLRGAKMQGAVLHRTKMQAADLGGAKMESADFREAAMQGADLRGAGLQRANLYGAQMQGADLRNADLKGALIYGTQLQGGNLEGSQLQAADLREAVLLGANLTDAKTESALVHFADLRGAIGLRQFQLSSVAGNGATLLPEPPDGWEELSVPSCLDASSPRGQYPSVRRSFDTRADGLPEAFSRSDCPPGERPRKTGTPWPVDADPPWGSQQADQSPLDYWRQTVTWSASRAPGDPID